MTNEPTNQLTSQTQPPHPRQPDDLPTAPNDLPTVVRDHIKWLRSMAKTAKKDWATCGTALRDAYNGAAESLESDLRYYELRYNEHASNPRRTINSDDYYTPEPTTPEPAPSEPSTPSSDYWGPHLTLDLHQTIVRSIHTNAATYRRIKKALQLTGKEMREGVTYHIRLAHTPDEDGNVSLEGALIEIRPSGVEKF